MRFYRIEIDLLDPAPRRAAVWRLMRCGHRRATSLSRSWKVTQRGFPAAYRGHATHSLGRRVGARAKFKNFATASCPLLIAERTQLGHRAMSEKGQLQTSREYSNGCRLTPRREL